MRVLEQVYPNCPETLDPYGPPGLVKQGVEQFTKRRNGQVAQAMKWLEIAATDIGKQIEKILRA